MRPLKYRLLVGIGLPCACVALALLFLWLGKTPPCVFYEATGLYCAGCGTGRSLLALLHGRLYAAFRYQPLLILSLPVILYLCAKLYISFVFGRDLLPFPALRARAIGWTVLGVVIGYWILRNLPFFPFYYLAPTSI